ncbi:type I restriction-modification system subunit M [Hornefia butyriciproducens]|uniref:type I restriction-modification system subunit M n=1 Tax=Hornefia butyriciproducens TaxID=2652293 RepID=UPI002A912CB6|nr:type I restriction-modification system subunit M [Hornefia butyriciproducens]MCI7413211.1 type I restriction-modification system subunit M [Clostridiales bacterium]MDY6212469.1 type I restriction-modification system subunit M [Hornefia butyriciproducens]
MNKQQLAAKIWESANRMRSKIEANEYKDYILGFIFYKYLSDKEEQWLLSEEYAPEDIREYVNEENEETVRSTQRNLGYFIGYKDLFSTWIQMGADFSVDNVRVALSSFTRLISASHKKVFEGIFNTLETGLSKLGDTSKSQTKAVSDLIRLINEIPMHGKQDYDVLGFIYEYLISNFAANAGKKAGEFYTPHEVSLLMSEIVADHLKGRSEIKIYDPTSGSGSLLINIGQTTAKYMEDSNRIRYYAQELKSNTYNLTRMNLVMRGILPDNIVTRNGDTLEEDWPYFDESDPAGTYDPLYVDAVVSNPPYSQRWEPGGKENDPRYSRYGLAPKAKADYAFLLHDLYHLMPDGIMTIVLPHGVLFRGGEEGKIRKNLIEQNNIDTIIGLPANIFFGTGIPTIVMVLRQKRENTDVLIIDASRGFVKEGKNNKLRASDIRRIADTVRYRRNTPRYSRTVSLGEIRQNDYNLNIPRYVDSSEAGENYDLYASMFGGIPLHELETLEEYWEIFPSLKSELFEGNGEYVTLKAADVRAAIRGNTDVQKFRDNFRNSFADFGDRLDDVLIDRAEELSIPKTEEEISADIFRRFENVPLLDPYRAYEKFENHYEEISGDLELIRMEGMATVRKVDPNMVIKKQKGKEAEVQDGWKGHVLPFDLVQRVCLHEELSSVRTMEERLSAIPGELEEQLERLSEEDKVLAGDALNDTNDGFVAGKVKGVLKELKEDPAENKEIIATLSDAEALLKEGKELKKEIKKAGETLHLKTKETIESLSDDEVRKLLHEKWTAPICDGICDLPENLLNEFTKDIEAMAEKYAVTLNDIEKEIRETEASLVSMLSELTGSEADMKGIRELQKLLGGEANA